MSQNGQTQTNDAANKYLFLFNKWKVEWGCLTNSFPSYNICAKSIWLPSKFKDGWFEKHLIRNKH